MPSSLSYCRLCAKSFEVTSLLHIFSDNKLSTGSLDLLIARYLPFPVSVSDRLSHYICKLCCAHVVRWHRFFTLCIKAQAQLKDMQKKMVDTSIQGDLANISEAKVFFNLFKSGNGLPVSKASYVSPRTAEQSVPSNLVKRKKANYCIARWCNNTNDMGIPFFRVPKDRNRALQWLSAADRMDLADKDVVYLYRCYLCATHFAKEMFINEHSKTLNRNAVPSIFPKPAYSQKIEEALSASETYPRELQGKRLKNILPKSSQTSQEISAQGILNMQPPQESYSQIIRVISDPYQKLEEPFQEVLFVRESVPSHSNIRIISMSSPKEGMSETIQTLGVQDSKIINSKQLQVLNVDVESERLNKPMSVGENSVQKIYSQTEPPGECSYICDDMTGHQNVKEIEFNQPDEVTRRDPGKKLSSCSENVCDANTLMDFTSDEPYCNSVNVMVLDFNQEPTNVKESSTGLQINIHEDQDITTNPLDLHVIPSEESLTSNMTIVPTLSSESPPFLIQDGLNFCSKTNNESPSSLGNIVGSQDLLLMHSSSNHIEESRDHGLRQDKNLNNLCDTVIPEPAPETQIVYGEPMMTEACARAIECTSPNHGQILEGLIDLDQFLDSG